MGVFVDEGVPAGTDLSTVALGRGVEIAAVGNTPSDGDVSNSEIEVAVSVARRRYMKGVAVGSAGTGACGLFK